MGRTSSLICRIQHHPARAELLPALLDSLAPLTAEVSTHASAPPNPWEGYQQALRDIPPCSHLVVLQDDVVVCRNFVATVEKIAAANPDTLVGLFLAQLPRRVAVDTLRATKLRHRYCDVRLRINEFCPVVALLWPRHKAQEFMAWADDNPSKLGHPAPRSDDSVLGRWCALNRQTVRFTIPSLVQHPDQTPSLIGRKALWGRDKGRVALQYIGEDDPLQFDWDPSPKSG